ncbi:MAG: mercury transporter MerT [Gemmatimonadaceae bacterium]|nr:mercury transporter MerT [Gemmatimonadaceae bacterium]
MKRSTMTGAGAVSAAFLASLCCIGPVVFVTLGIGAGLASRFEPLRPIFVALTVALVGAGFYAVYGKPPVPIGRTCEPDERCAVPRNSRRDEAILWAATVLAILLLTFPQWSLWFV